MDRKPLRIAQIKSEHLHGLFNKDVWLPALCVAALGECLKHRTITEQQAGVAKATFNKFKTSRAQRTKLGTLVKVVMSAGIKADLLADTGLDSEVIQDLNNVIERIVGEEYEVPDYAPDELSLDEDSELWQTTRSNAAGRVDEYERRQKRATDIDQPRIRLVNGPVSGIILDLVTCGRLAIERPVGKRSLRRLVEAQCGCRIPFEQVDDAVTELVARGHMRCVQGAVCVNQLTVEEWCVVIEYRKRIESLNIECLLQDRDACRCVHVDLSEWCTDMQEAIHQNDVVCFFDLDIRFHLELASNCEFAQQVLRGILPFIRRAGTHLGTKETMSKLLQGHWAIVEPVRAIVDLDSSIVDISELITQGTSSIKQHLANAFDLFARNVTTHDTVSQAAPAT